LRRTAEEGKADGDFCAVREGRICLNSLCTMWHRQERIGVGMAEAAMYLRLNGVLPPTAKK